MKHVPFRQKMFQAESPFWKRRWMSGAYAWPTPGNILHMHVLKHKPFKLFDRWIRKTAKVKNHHNTANKMYWRTHPKELVALRWRI